MTPMRVLGIDPGYDRLGIAVVEGERERPVLIFSTCIETQKAENFSKRLHGVVRALKKIIEDHHPDEVSIEEIFFSKNQKTAMLVAHARGAMVYLLEELRIPFTEYNPSAIKIAITGEGRAEKRQVIDMLQKLIVLPKTVILDDEYDAIAVAVTHLASTKISTRKH
jgi:crossover junction endodeoxyribonuclease RuvC